MGMMYYLTLECHLIYLRHTLQDSFLWKVRVLISNIWFCFVKSNPVLLGSSNCFFHSFSQQDSTLRSKQQKKPFKNAYKSFEIFQTSLENMTSENFIHALKNESVSFAAYLWDLCLFGLIKGIMQHNKCILSYAIYDLFDPFIFIRLWNWTF